VDARRGEEGAAGRREPLPGGRPANKKIAAEDRRALVKAGDRLRSRLAAALAFEHGSTSVQLKEFGIRPRPAGRTRTKPAPVPNPQPEPPASPAAGTSGTEKK